MPRTELFRIDCIVGARPNFVKIAPIMRALRARSEVRARLIHTGQHYDIAMSDVFFEELAIPAPDLSLDVGPGTGTEQTARIMLALERVLEEDRPDLLLVVGDVNSTVAAALVAAKLLVPLAHVEAGLRSFDRTMPEEVNRLVTDRLSDLLFTTERSAEDNLLREGVEAERIHFVGNVMIDTLHACLARALPARETWAEIGAEIPAETGAGEGFAARAERDGYAFVTLHRPSNVDDPERLREVLEALDRISRDIPLVFPVHPRTRAKIAACGYGALLASEAILACPPLSYLRAIGQIREARLIVTDSGGVQEESTALGVPCLTVRENTERPITILEGTNELVGLSNERLFERVAAVLGGGGKSGRVPALWDGRASERIVDAILVFLAGRDP